MLYAAAMGVRVILVFVMTMMIAACGGPSPQQIATAKSTTYTENAQALLDGAAEVVGQTYKIASIDQVSHVIYTEYQWYSPEGDRESPGAGDRVNARGGSVVLQLVISVVAVDGAPGAGAHHAIVIVPKTRQLISWSPQPRELAPDDPNLPPWIHGRVDDLAVAIHDALIKHPR